MGELKSFNVYHSYLEGLEPYGDAERGRLLTACLQYSMTGEVPELRGNEKYIFPSWKAQIDRDKEKYMARCQQQADNASARWNNADACNGMPTHAKDAKDKDKDKDKDNSVYVGLLDARLAQCNQCYEQNIGTISPTVSEAIQYWLEKVEPGLICEAIKTAVKRNSRRWAYIEGILKNCEKQNIRTADAFLSEQKNPSAPKNANPFLRDDI